jgi:hypothetical protein
MLGYKESESKGHRGETTDVIARGVQIAYIVQ